MSVPGAGETVQALARIGMQTSGHPFLDVKAVNQGSPPEIKIALFRSLADLRISAR
ncbi:MAG TPA: hypothetical protein VF020_18985 [Chthoniobacterales bacterium]